MVWSDLYGLEFYSPNPQWGCYADPVFDPHDILMQANGFTGGGGLTVAVSLFQPNGTGFIDDVTSYFEVYIGSYVYASATYYFVNLRCNAFSPGMIANQCFVIRVTVFNDGDIVFDKYTQKYELKNTAVYASGITIGGVEAPICAPGAIENNCRFNYFKFASSFECVDNFTGDFYGTGTTIAGTPFAYTRFSWIEGRIRQVPREVKRTINIKCRTQRTQDVKQYLVTGDNPAAFPIWKVDEMESMLLANKIYVNDTEYQSQGGTIFEQYGEPKGCQYRYKLSMKLQGCQRWQIFGCVPTCEDLATYYMFPRPFARVYDDTLSLIATDTDELLIYFASKPGYQSAASLPFALPCPSDALIKVQSSGALPQYLYVDEIIPSQKIYPKTLGANTLDFLPLCNGIQNNGWPPELGEPFNEQTPDYPPELGDPLSESEDSFILQVSAEGFWMLDTLYSSGMNNEGEVTLNISVAQTTATTNWINEPIASISGNGIPNQDVVIYGSIDPNIPGNAMVRITNTGQIQYTGDSIPQGNDQSIQFFSTKYNINN